MIVRFIYDSIYISFIKKENSRFINDDDETDIKCAYIYVKQLFEKKHSMNANKKSTQSTLQTMYDSIFKWNTTSYLTTMSLSIHVIAGVFLYYLVCSFVFIYTSRTTGHVLIFKSILNSLIQTSKLRMN